MTEKSRRTEVVLLSSGPYSITPKQIPVVEDAKNCFYIGTSSVPNAKDGSLEKGWSYTPLDIFWTPIRHPESMSHMFGLFRREGKIWIRGVNEFDGKIQGVFIPSHNTLIYSCHVHDFFCPPEGIPRVCVDGGRDYLKYNYEHANQFETCTIDLTERTFESEHFEGHYTVPFSSHNLKTEPPYDKKD